MTWKTSLAGLPFGGGKGGIRVDPEELSRRELCRLTDAYVQAFREAIGPDTDIMAPDLNTNEEVMGWLVDAWAATGPRDATVLNRRPSWLQKILESRPLVILGTYSYGMYLFHMLVWKLLQDWRPAELAADGTPFDPAGKRGSTAMVFQGGRESGVRSSKAPAAPQPPGVVKPERPTQVLE